jgi:hypothetical protein
MRLLAVPVTNFKFLKNQRQPSLTMLEAMPTIARLSLEQRKDANIKGLHKDR